MTQLAAVFLNKQNALAAWRSLREEFPLTEFYTPFELEDLEGRKKTPFTFAFFGGLIGWCLGWWLQVDSAVFDYPLNVGGRPDFSWPAFVPVSFVLMILLGGLAVFLSMLWLLLFPAPFHPIFSLEDYDLSRDRFYLLIPFADKVLKDRLHALLTVHSPVSIAELT